MRFKKMTDELIPIRLSHLLGQSGVGAIVRGPNGLVVVQDTRQWTDRHGTVTGKTIPYVERVRAALEIDQELREPPVAKELPNGQVDGVVVPATRFPSWMRCPACGALHYRPWQANPPDYEPRCDREGCKRGPKLEQVTWVLAHSDGHLADVPWQKLTHAKAPNPQQRECKHRDKLHLIERGYESRTLTCGACKVTKVFTGTERVFYGNGRIQPWTKDDLVTASPDTEGNTEQPAQVLAVNDTRVYAPEADAALVIPPESRVRKGTVVDRLYRNSEVRSQIDKARTRLQRKSVIRTLAEEYRCTTAEIETAIADIKQGYPLYGENPTPGQLLESEFTAFLEILPDQRDDEDLVTRNHSHAWHALAASEEFSGEQQNPVASVVAGLRHLVRVDRLKAVKVFRGFSRLGGDTVPSSITDESDWLPAIELYGEGIFIALDEERLSQWEHSPALEERLQQVNLRLASTGQRQPNPLTTRFMLLHTLSHLLIRQIESEGGYPAASLVERIYCSRTPVPMAGILIHVAVPDIAGSLGGLAELSEPRRFLRLLIRALDHARWCSLDPVCGEHEGQGPNLLNRAACHACALVPEPACEYGNTLLDRVFVKGDASLGLPSFFGLT